MSAAAPTIAYAADAASARSALLPERLFLFALVAALCCAGSASGLLQGPAVITVALAAIAIAMWHGAYDQVQAEQVLAPLGRRWPVVFLGSYALLAALTLLGWWLAPLPSLLLFLLYAAWHFGTEPELWTPAPLAGIAAVALGAVPIVAACRWHAGEAAPIFAQMLHGKPRAQDFAAALAHSLAMACWPLVAVAAGGIAAGSFGRGSVVKAELLGVLALELVLFRMNSPLLAFAVFFCCWHTPEHLIATSMPERPGQTLHERVSTNLKAGLLPWLLALCGTAGVFLLGRREAIAYQAEIFIVLSALTVPHMALNELRRTVASRESPGRSANKRREPLRGS